MAPKETPSSVMYATLKSFGVSNREAATILMNTQLTFDGRPLHARIGESSQLSRRIVHTAPGEIPRGLFNNFQITSLKLARMVLDEHAVEYFNGNMEKTADDLVKRIMGSPSDKMMQALRSYNISSAVYKNMAAYICRADLANEKSRFDLLLMMFIVTGCTGNPRAASIIVVDYATEILGVDFQTAQTVVNAVGQPEELHAKLILGLVRMSEGKIKAGTQMHVLNPNGTEIGMLPQAKHIVADVGSDVSRRHAFIWQEGSQWYVKGLGSTNGIWLISGTTGKEVVVEEPRAIRDEHAEPRSVEIAPTDILCLGTTTQFMVMPLLSN